MQQKSTLMAFLLSLVLLADHKIYSILTDHMPFELIYGQKPIMPIEKIVST